MKRPVIANILDKNSIIIYLNGAEYLQSYNVIVACRKNGKRQIDGDYYGFSKTTSKHINRFFELDSKEVRKLVKSFDIELVNLNEE